MHPGGHGLHIHLVTGCYLHVNQIRRIWRACGGGRIHVKPIAASRAAYVAKYISKAGRPECLKSARMWAPLGGLDYVRIGNVVIESDWSRIYGVLAATIGAFRNLAWRLRRAAVLNVERGREWSANLASIDSLGELVLGNTAGAMPGFRPF
jgi:hypothetical protein